MAKIIGINGSPRKNKNSALLLDHALAGAKEMGAEVERIDLIDLKFSGCRSCFACKQLGGSGYGRCVVQDDLKAVLEKILQADGVIISAPIYFGDVPGMVRNLFERLWFPGLTYKKDGSINYTKRVKTALFYTMNVTDAAFYEKLIGSHKGTMDRFLGETRMLCATDTLQFDDYSRYSGDMFDPVHKQQRHETQFPLDCAEAEKIGKWLAE